MARLSPLLLPAAGLVVYANGLPGVFLFDDSVHIVSNPHIRQLWPPAWLLHSYRPVVDLSLALNYSLGGLDVRGYHSVNLTIHVLASLALYGIIRRLLPRMSGEPQSSASATLLALIVALLWEIHPLQTQSVTYVIQRAESMMGLFYLLTFYCVLRAAASLRAGVWCVAAILCFGMGMASKIVMVSAPLVVLLFDRIFLSSSFPTLIRRRWGLYLGMLVILGAFGASRFVRGVLDPGNIAATVGFGYKGITPWDYGLTQFGVLLRYLSLAFWPVPLCLDYRWPVAASVSQVVPPAVAVAVGVGGAVWLLVRAPRLGFTSAWFFLILAPTSSFVPVKDTLFEHRMYLPLAGIIAIPVIGTHRMVIAIISRYASTSRKSGLMLAILAVAASVSLGWTSIVRNTAYRSAVTMWRDVVAKRPSNARAYENLGTALVVEGKLVEAVEEFRKAVAIEPDFTSARQNLANALLQTGQFSEAARAYDEVLQLKPEDVDVRVNQAFAFEQLGRWEEAVHAYRTAASVSAPGVLPESRARAYYNLGAAFGKRGDFEGACSEFHEAIRLSPRYEKAHYSLAQALTRLGRLEEAIRHYRQTLKINPNHKEAREALSRALSVKERRERG